MRVVALGQALIHAPVDWPEELRTLTRGADAVICNFEGCLPPPGAVPMKPRTLHAAHPDALAMLRDLGVTHLVLANNHAWDYGHPGMAETRRQARAAGFATAGTGANAAEALAPALGGRRAGKLALIAVDAGPVPPWAAAGAGPGLRRAAAAANHHAARRRDRPAGTARRRRRPGRAPPPPGRDRL